MTRMSPSPGGKIASMSGTRCQEGTRVKHRRFGRVGTIKRADIPRRSGEFGPVHDVRWDDEGTVQRVPASQLEAIQ